MWLRVLIHSFVCLGAIGVSWKFSIQYNFADFKAFTEVLLNVSAAVFTLMGIWIAFLYPNALSRIVDPKRIATADFSDNLQDSKRLTAIVGSVLISALIVLSILSLMLLKLFLLNTPFYCENREEIKHAVLGIAATLFSLQSDAVMGVIVANVMFINDLHHKKSVKQVENDY